MNEVQEVNWGGQRGPQKMHADGGTKTLADLLDLDVRNGE
jgi:hypothetical protein